MIVIEALGEKGTIVIIRIVCAGTMLVSNSFNFSWNPKMKINIFWTQAKVEGITDECGTSADYSDYYLFQLNCLVVITVVV